MFTLQAIQSAHATVKSGADFPQYVQDIKKLGLDYYDFMVADGHSQYVSTTGETLASEPKYAPLTVANQPNVEALRHTIKIHQQGQTDFMTFCQQAADAGVKLWRTDATNLQVIYLDTNDNEMINEPIPDASQY